MMNSRESFEEVCLALWEIRYSAKNVMPAKAVEECPEGKDLRPPCTEESALVGQLVNGSRVIGLRRISYPAHALSFLSHLHRARKSGRNLPKGGLSHGQEKWCGENTNRLGSSRILSQAG